MNPASKTIPVKYITKADQHVALQVFWVVAFAAATALGARVEIPLQPVPFTLQTLVVLLAGAFLGSRNGAMSQLLYLGAGALGAPVFASGAIGVAKLVGPTGGYLLAFPLAAAVVGVMIGDSKSLLRIAASMMAGLALIFASGVVHLAAFYTKDLAAAVTSGFLLFSWWDVIKLSAAAALYYEFGKRWPRIPA